MASLPAPVYGPLREPFGHLRRPAERPRTNSARIARGLVAGAWAGSYGPRLFEVAAAEAHRPRGHGSRRKGRTEVQHVPDQPSAEDPDPSAIEGTAQQDLGSIWQAVTERLRA